MSRMFAALLLLPAIASAHDLWVERAPEGFLARYGHRGGESLPIDAAKVKAIRCFDGKGAPRDLLAAAGFGAKEVRFAGPCAVASVFYDGGYWSLTPDGEVNLPRTKVASAVRSWSSRQYAKWVDARSPAAGAPVGDELEIVPVTDLAKAREGDKIAVRVLASGRPLPNAAVAVGHRTLGETDSKGELRLRLRAPGVQSISTSVRRAKSTPEAEAEVLEASLTFEVAK
jgi:uncharacterized GH25 family protein